MGISVFVVAVFQQEGFAVGFWVVRCYCSSLVYFSLSSCPQVVVKGLIGPHSHQRLKFEGGEKRVYSGWEQLSKKAAESF
jgi:hypothetical protein